MMNDLAHQHIASKQNRRAKTLRDHAILGEMERKTAPFFLAVMLVAAAAIGATLATQYKSDVLEAAAQQRAAGMEAEIEQRTRAKIAKVFADKQLLKIMCAR